MGRPEDTFSFSDLAIASSMSKRQIQHLADARLLPENGSIATLKRACVIGGFSFGGVPIIAAGRIAKTILDEFNEPDGEVPSALRYLARGLMQKARAEIPSPDSDYWYHRALWMHRSEADYRPGRATKSDALIEIVDKAHIYFCGTSGLPFFTPWGGKEAVYFGRIEGWERGSDASIITLPELVPLDPDHPDYLIKGKALADLADRARANAVAVLTVNVSLAVRNGLDRLAAHRESKGRKT